MRSFTSSKGGGAVSRLSSRMITCQPNWVSTGVLVYCPFSSPAAAAENGATICFSLNQPSSPPLAPEGPVDFSLASSEKSLPLSSSLMMASASSCSLTRICRALNYLIACPICSSYSFFASSSDTGLLVMKFWMAAPARAVRCC